MFAGVGAIAGAAVGLKINAVLGTVLNVAGGLIDASLAFFDVRDVARAVEPAEKRLRDKGLEVSGQNVIGEMNDDEIEKAGEGAVPAVLTGLFLAISLPFAVAGTAGRKIARGIEGLFLKSPAARTGIGRMIIDLLKSRRRARMLLTPNVYQDVVNRPRKDSIHLGRQRFGPWLLLRTFAGLQRPRRDFYPYLVLVVDEDEDYIWYTVVGLHVNGS